MTRHLAHIDDRAGVFAPQYYGTVQYYARMASYSNVVIDNDLRYNKRFKSVHRCEIVDTRHRIMLTLPVCQAAGATKWSQINVSPHGQWWADHRISLESAYGRTPFFEYYIDRFLPWLKYRDMSVTDFDRGIDTEIRRILGLESRVVYDMKEMPEMPYDDFRHNELGEFRNVEYYQVRADRLGFVGGLSVLDLIFNIGPESPLVLKQLL